MRELVFHLGKRRQIMMGVVVALGVLAVAISFNFQITPTSYFGGKYNSYFLIGLVAYKFIELPILYYVLLHRHIIHLRKNVNYQDQTLKIRKHARLLLFLIPQGNTVFGIIAYKLSGNVLYFLFFSLIALITLILINPNKLIE
jgi:hypothetical protein